VDDHADVVYRCKYCGFRPPKKEREVAGEVLSEELDE
jgi:DNA-directed RNA polymerase subunit RPC12/RpoP